MLQKEFLRYKVHGHEMLQKIVLTYTVNASVADPC